MNPEKQSPPPKEGFRFSRSVFSQSLTDGEREKKKTVEKKTLDYSGIEVHLQNIMERRTQHTSYLAGRLASGAVCAWSISSVKSLNPCPTMRLFGINKQEDTKGG